MLGQQSISIIQSSNRRVQLIPTASTIADYGTNILILMVNISQSCPSAIGLNLPGTFLRGY
jgi:hypothetical protein